MRYHKKNDFNPDYFHPYYFIRKGLYDKIAQNAFQLSGRLLDFGCGSKPYQPLLSVKEYVGLDFANEGHAHDFENIDLYYDGKKIPFADNYFDSVLSTEVFEHIFNLDEVLKELNRVLKTGGTMLITCPFVWIEHEVPYDYARYTRFALEDLFSKNNFSIIKFEKSGNFMTTIAQLISLYFFENFYYRHFNKNKFLRKFYNLFFVFFPNITGVLMNKIFPVDSRLYLNNVIIAEKKSDL